MLVGIVDLGINNLTSVQRAFSLPLKSTETISIIDRGHEGTPPDLLILPGLGKFGAGMSALQDRNLLERITYWSSEGTKIVGICLGMQLLGTISQESDGVKGLDLMSSRIERLPNVQNERIPHTGWADTKFSNATEYFPSLGTQGDFYFVHSYHVIPEDVRQVLTITPFGGFNFVSSIFSKNILGVQFHPEKSGGKGKKLVSEIVEWARDEN